jgi:FtsZ-interacting cell division protein YlmF
LPDRGNVINAEGEVVMALGMSDADGWPSRGHRHRFSEPRQPEAAAEEKPTIVIVRPRDHEDVYEIGYEIGVHFRRDLPVIINLEDLTAENATRVVDFVSGTIFGRRGDIERLSNRLFLIIPPGSTVIKT